MYQFGAPNDQQSSGCWSCIFLTKHLATYLPDQLFWFVFINVSLMYSNRNIAVDVTIYCPIEKSNHFLEGNKHLTPERKENIVSPVRDT